ncbi:hypothetical protein GM418_23730 [Maribellus comscasis]|uniref:Uncharacterized protein n=1 Tax=Maribellus comscasis TaxID=2681766 RepID=A0A6I6JZH8_9BACT|nr:hypothetical protein [Maribellus comscasis]QGY46560.1 hypothetical protein GM418_23730 [Maribellus comscasis]
MANLRKQGKKGEIENPPGVDLEYEKPDNAKLIFRFEGNEINIDRILDFFPKIKFSLFN